MDWTNMAKLPALDQTRVQGGFFGNIVQRVGEEMLPFQWKALNDDVGGAKSGCIHNFRVAAGLEAGEHYGYVFQDSDMAKWLEAVGFYLSTHIDPEMEQLADEVIDLIGQAQQPDGYLDTYYIITGMDKRWSNLRDNHELYCAGHMLEAAVAYAQATGKTKLLEIMQKFVAHIDDTFGPEPQKLHGYPGHEEIELALCKLYEMTGDEKALKLAKYFIDERGQEPNYFVEEARKLRRETVGEGEIDLRELVHIYGNKYGQHHLPVREQTTIEGHSVRALYLAAGMAHTAMLTKDESLLNACRTLFDNVANKRMYITGGVGSTHIGEAFTFDYDLPNDTMYAETCASIALIFFCRNMLRMELKGRYGDVMERALYNTCLAGMSLDQKTFFYVNPLSVWPEASRKDPNKSQVLPVRPKWFGCACCPPNLARLLSSLPQYAYASTDDSVAIHLYMQSDVTLEVGEKQVDIAVRTEYPNDGLVKISAGEGNYALKLRLPGWCDTWAVKLNGAFVQPEVEDGYIVLEKGEGAAEIELCLQMRPKRVYANSRVRADTGRVAIMRGPLVYCLESVDNDEELHLVSLPRNAVLMEDYRPELLEGTRVICAAGKRIVPNGDDLYSEQLPQVETVPLMFIPYYKWANRGENEMDVWVRE